MRKVLILLVVFTMVFGICLPLMAQQNAPAQGGKRNAKEGKPAELTPAEIGQALDLLEIPISKCQLGLFGYSPVSRIIKPAESVAEDLEAAIRAAMSDDRLPCAAAFQIAAGFKLAKIRVSSACEKLKIKISACQLGAF